MKKILISGGPVGAHLDSIKIITNNFKGGRMISLAKAFSAFHDVHYLSSIKPDDELTWQPHKGYHDYHRFLMEHAAEYDAIILGAAIANLIPKNPWEGKFPSHNYQEGEEINIPFLIAPRIINEVKAHMSHGAHLFGFKLLDGVEHSELINAAYDIVLASKATAVFANDRQDLDTKYAVTKEMGEHVLADNQDIVSFVSHLLVDEYYKTSFFPPSFREMAKTQMSLCKELTCVNGKKFDKQYGYQKYRFGTVAVRVKDNGFITTVRGKKELGDLVHVLNVDHRTRCVHVENDGKGTKATLNAPLLDNIFVTNKDVNHIVHYHEQVEGLPTTPYAPAGTVRDSVRLSINTSFNIKGHGVFLLFNEEGKQL